MRSFSCSNRMLVTTFLGVLSGAVAFAQMGGGMMGSSGSQGGMHTGAGQSNQMGQGSGGMMTGGMNGSNGMMGTGGMGVGMGANLGVGPDGTPYFVQRTTASGSNQTAQPAQIKSELVALDPQTGATKWTLEVTGNRVSGPVAAKDGQVFLTVDDFAMASRFGQSTTGQSSAKLLVVSATGTVLKTVDVESGLVSAPILAGDPANYSVYVIGYDVGSTSSMGPLVQGQRTLYAFYPNGTLKFKVKLSQ